MEIRNNWNIINSFDFFKIKSSDTSDTDLEKQKSYNMFEAELKEDIGTLGNEFYENLKSK